jgi:HemK-like putative methylase
VNATAEPGREPDLVSLAGLALAREGRAALVLSRPPDLPSAELLLDAGQGGDAAAAYRALDRLPWRWRAGADGPSRRSDRQRFTFDDGFVLTVHARLDAGPLPGRWLAPLGAHLWRGSVPAGDGLWLPLSEPALVYLAMRVADGRSRSRAQLAELEAHAGQVHDWDQVWRLAASIGVHEVLLEHLPTETLPPRPQIRGTGPALRAMAWRGYRAARHARGVRLVTESWRSAVTRCRFDGLELLAGPGVFLPRRMSEPTPALAAERLAAFDRPAVVDVGTGCGAIALALARRVPSARILGLDVDANALRWAARNARQLGAGNVAFARSSLLASLPPTLSGQLAMVVANVPCVAAADFGGASDAPAEAYVGEGPEALGLQRRLAEQALEHLAPGGWLLVQIAPAQWPSYRAALEAMGYRVEPPTGNDIAIIATARRP